MTAGDLYILDREQRPEGPVPQDKWLQWMAHFSNKLRDDRVGLVRVTTTFLGIEQHRKNGMTGPPLLFETLVDDGETVQVFKLYSSRDDALVGHETALRRARR